jgi:hypothetical protein
MKPDVIDDRDKFMRGVDRAHEMILPYCHIDQDAANPFNRWRDMLFFLEVAVLNSSIFSHKLHGAQYTPQLETFFTTTLLNI